MRLEAWANDVRRQTKYHDEKHRYRNRGLSEDDDDLTAERTGQPDCGTSETPR